MLEQRVPLFFAISNTALLLQRESFAVTVNIATTVRRAQLQSLLNQLIWSSHTSSRRQYKLDLTLK